MIIKGQARGRAKQLAAHLLRADQNETVRLFECRGTLAEDVEGALIEMELRGKAARTEKPLYHASISPEASTPLSPQQVREAVHLLEGRLGLHGQPRVVVIHRKDEREHVHVVWCRVDPATGTAVHMSWNYRIHEQVARLLERRFGHRTIDSSFDKRGWERTHRSTKDYELRQAERSRRPIEALSAELTALWHQKTSGRQFQEDLAKAGYRLARGDRRVFVVIDREGNVHSLARRIQGAKARDISRDLRDVPLNQLSSVAEVRQEIACSKPSPTNTAHFGAAAQELASRGGALRMPARRIIRRAKVNLRAIVSIERFATQRPARLAAASEVIVAASGTNSLNYRSRRAALVAHYASKIAHALHHLSPEEIEAAIAALRYECDAALENLKDALPTRGATRKRRRLRGSVESHPHVRFSARMRPRPRY